MGRHVAGECPELEKLVEEAIAGVGSEIAALSVPRLWGVVLGGGYGRGEGGVKRVERGELRVESTLSNDLDFFAITEEGVPEAETVAAIGAALQPVAAKWSQTLGVDVDFAVKTPARLKHDEARLMVQELVHGYVDVCGAPGETLFAGLARRAPESLPWMEAARLLMNRGAGLLLALEAGRTDDFIARNINKCILGAGDAYLISRGLYRWRATARATALAADAGVSADAARLYARAVEWKFRPRPEPVCDWETAREAWRNARTEVAAAGGTNDGRSLRSAARWLVRRRTLGELATFGRDPVMRVLARIARGVEDRAPMSADLVRDWEIFN